MSSIFHQYLSWQTLYYSLSLLGDCNTHWPNEFLKPLSAAYPHDYILLVIDNAVWHKSSRLDNPANISFEFTSPYTPEVNPIEQVWTEIHKRSFQNKTLKTLDDVMKKFQEVIQGLEQSLKKTIVHRQWLQKVSF